LYEANGALRSRFSAGTRRETQALGTNGGWFAYHCHHPSFHRWYAFSIAHVILIM